MALKINAQHDLLNQFITFSPIPPIRQCTAPTPISDIYNTTFIISSNETVPPPSIIPTLQIDLLNQEKEVVAENIANIQFIKRPYARAEIRKNLTNYLIYNQCYILKLSKIIDNQIKAIGYSNLLKFIIPNLNYSHIQYRCYENQFGLPFGTTYIDDNDQEKPVFIEQLLPIRMHSPQYGQSDKTYEKQDGEVMVLYAKYYKEWSCTTEFFSESMHDKIITALSCDELYINGKIVTKTDNYQIDWDNYDLDCDGKTKLARATFKVRENITQRNSNY